jgi:hypothetical protein
MAMSRKLAADRFWYDLALSTGEAQLKALLATAPSSNIIYGSDFPYAPKLGIYGGLLQYSNFIRSAEGKKIGPQQLNANATRLLQKHASENTFLPEEREKGAPKYEPEFGLEENDDAKKAREQLEEHHRDH